MNRYGAFPRRVPGATGWWAMIRVCREAEAGPVMDVNGKPKVFGTKGEAAEECLKHIIRFMNGHPIRGEKFEMGGPKAEAMAKAEMLFMGGGRTVQVERL